MSMTKQRIEPMNEAERAWIRDELANARRLISLHAPDVGDDPYTPEVLDRVFKAAYESARPSDADYANVTINAIGIAFGQYLVETLRFEWCAVFDGYGQELAVVGLPGKANVLVFPPNLVAKRWTAGTTDFLWYVYKGIEEDFAKFREHWEGHNHPLQFASSTRSGILSWFRRLLSRAARN